MIKKLQPITHNINRNINVYEYFSKLRLKIINYIGIHNISRTIRTMNM